jgi:predicted lipoprotein
MNSIRLIFVGFFFLIVFSCGNDEGVPTTEDSFDRNAMLASWADNIIIPAFENYLADLNSLESSYDNFVINSDELSYDELVLSWLDAYKSWQRVAIFDIGKAEEIGLRNFTNIYPTDKELIESNIESQNYNLELPSNFDAQGFPALDYLFFGTAESKSEIITKLTEPKYDEYISDILLRMSVLSNDVLMDWKTGYRTIFISNDGSSATASVDKLVNDFLFHYEKFFRAGKIGIPAGVFSNSEMSSSVEAPYSNVYSKELAQVAFKAIQDFFVGLSFEDGINGVSLDDYLKLIMTQNNTTDVSQRILNQWISAESKLSALSESLKEQVENDNSKMLEFYDELQKAVILLKVDMLQAINIQVDFVDADGD